MKDWSIVESICDIVVDMMVVYGVRNTYVGYASFADVMIGTRLHDI
jgi:hypothetical protein